MSVQNSRLVYKLRLPNYHLLTSDLNASHTLYLSSSLLVHQIYCDKISGAVYLL